MLLESRFIMVAVKVETILKQISEKIIFARDCIYYLADQLPRKSAGMSDPFTAIALVASTDVVLILDALIVFDRITGGVLASAIDKNPELNLYALLFLVIAVILFENIWYRYVSPPQILIRKLDQLISEPSNSIKIYGFSYYITAFVLLGILIAF